MEDEWFECIKGGDCLPEKQYKALCERVKEILLEESNVQPIQAPVNICGDIHGQFYDLLQLFRIGGEIPSTRYIFMGDYVDRGYHSLETLQYLLCLKAKHPGHITLLRGNHESRGVNMMYGFYDECLKKYGNSNAWKYSNEVFDHLGMAAVVEGDIFCVHGGLSPDVKTIDQIRTIERNGEIPTEGAFSDMVWSDPEDISGWRMSPRGAGWYFGADVVTDFLFINDLSLISRSHQLVQEGYKYWFKEKLVNVWSAPNYVYRCGNVASILAVGEKLERNYQIFDASQESTHPIRATVPYFL